MQNLNEKCNRQSLKNFKERCMVLKSISASFKYYDQFLFYEQEHVQNNGTITMLELTNVFMIHKMKKGNGGCQDLTNGISSYFQTDLNV